MATLCMYVYFFHVAEFVLIIVLYFHGFVDYSIIFPFLLFKALYFGSYTYLG